MAIDRQALALVQNHGYHPAATEVQKKRHAAVRALFLETSLLLNRILPQGRHRSLAMTELEKAEMWANRALALEGGPASLDEMDDDIIEVIYESVFPERNQLLPSRKDMIDRLNAALSGSLND